MTGLVQDLAAAGFERFGALALLENRASIGLLERLGFSRREDEVVVGARLDWIGMTADADAVLAARAGKVGSPPGPA